jgi:hypothetical protein
VTLFAPVRKTKLLVWGEGPGCGPARFPHKTLAGLAQASLEKEAWPLRFGNLGSFGFVDQQLEVLRSNETSEAKGEGKKGRLP